MGCTLSTASLFRQTYRFAVVLSRIVVYGVSPLRGAFYLHTSLCRGYQARTDFVSLRQVQDLQGVSPLSLTQRRVLSSTCADHMVVSLRANLNAGVQLLRGLRHHGSPRSRIRLVSKNICILALVPAELLVKRQPHVHLSTCFNRHATLPSHSGSSGYDNRVKRCAPACTGIYFVFFTKRSTCHG
jgi:hypothetical protein